MHLRDRCKISLPSRFQERDSSPLTAKSSSPHYIPTTKIDDNEKDEDFAYVPTPSTMSANFSTRPPYKLKSKPFNPNLPPAAFPSLPLGTKRPPSNAPSSSNSNNIALSNNSKEKDRALETSPAFSTRNATHDRKRSRIADLGSEAKQYMCFRPFTGSGVAFQLEKREESPEEIGSPLPLPRGFGMRQIEAVELDGMDLGSPRSGKGKDDSGQNEKSEEEKRRDSAHASITIDTYATTEQSAAGFGAFQFNPSPKKTATVVKYTTYGRDQRK